MKRTSFHHGWQVREQVSPLFELTRTLTPYSDVRLPHDAMIGRDRSPGLTPATAYLPGGAYQYRKVFTGPEHPNARQH